MRVSCIVKGVTHFLQFFSNKSLSLCVIISCIVCSSLEYREMCAFLSFLSILELSVIDAFQEIVAQYVNGLVIPGLEKKLLAVCQSVIYESLTLS